jgi:tetraacyldisaccharide 4'-kinase
MARFEDWLFEPEPGLFGEIVRLPFSALSALYLPSIKLRALAYQKNIFKSHQLPVPVVAVGNLTVGGSGKTPTAIWLAQNLARNGFKPAISIRGYHSPAENSMAVIDGKNPGAADPELVGDEAALIAQKLPGIPVLVGKNRVASGRKAVELGANILVLDDGFQHLRLKRDVNILLIDGNKLLDREKMFPRGRLREPVSAIARGQVVISRGDEKLESNLARISEINPVAKIFRMRYRVTDPGRSAGKKAFAFAGIAEPGQFFALAKDAGVELVGKKEFSDHHIYVPDELRQVQAEAKSSGAEIILTTEKDRARIKSMASGLPLLALGIEPDFFGTENALLEEVVRLCKDK